MTCLSNVTSRERNEAEVVEFVRTQLPNVALLETFDFASGRGDLHYAGRGFATKVFKQQGSYV